MNDVHYLRSGRRTSTFSEIYSRRNTDITALQVAQQSTTNRLFIHSFTHSFNSDHQGLYNLH